MIKLNLGCQLHYFDGWVNMDIVGDDKDWKVDIVADVSKLPQEDNSVDFIYAGHLVEHFYPDTLTPVIAEWRRVLKPGGKLVIVTPDCGSVFKDYASGKLTIEHTWQQIYGRIYHYDSAPERHHIAFDEAMLRSMCMGYKMGGHESISWSGLDNLDFNAPPEELVPFMDKHISRAHYQLGIILTK